MRFLVVEDQKDLNRIISKRLSAEGYTVDSCFDGMEALDFVGMAEYDGIILDVMMPKLDGFSFLEKIRQTGNMTPVLFLTAKDTVSDKVSGLDLGANDYLVKPFAFEELMARIRAMVRKTSGSTSNTYTALDLTLDSGSHRVFRSGKEINLSSKEFALLEFMLRNKNIVLSREKIENNLWNFDYLGGTNAVDVYIRYLRKKIDDDFDVKLIHTVRGSGYVLKDR